MPLDMKDREILKGILEEIKKSNEFLLEIKKSFETPEISWDKYTLFIPLLTTVVFYAYSSLKLSLLGLTLIYIALISAMLYSDREKIRKKFNWDYVRKNFIQIIIFVLFVGGIAIIVVKKGLI